jgi:GNAT superfamily N-acetyltransferase
MVDRDDRFWAEFLGIEPGDWGSPGLSITSHSALSGFRGLWCFRRNERIVVSAPKGWVARLQSIFAGTNYDQLLEASFIRTSLGTSVDSIIGPAFQGSLDPRQFRIITSVDVRFLTPEDDLAVDRFRRQCMPEDWQNSGFEKTSSYRAAYFLGDSIVALAGYRPWTKDAGDPCVVTSADARGQGYGTAVVNSVVGKALEDNKLLLYQTLESNIGAVRIAAKLGYKRYARHLAVRLKSDEPMSGTNG